MSLSRVSVFVAIVVLLSATPLVGAQGQWVKHPGNPVLTADTSPGSWEAGGLIRPRVLYDGKVFKMWYGGQSSQGIFQIGYASSPDGIMWTKNPAPVLAAGVAAWEGNYVTLGSALWTGSQYMMWYRGTNPQGGAGVGLATSPDGVTWTRFAGNPVMKATTIDWNFLTNPYVIQVGSSFMMWYACEAAGSTYIGICYATSGDGKAWTKYTKPVLSSSALGQWDGGDLYSPTVIFDGGSYGMWYSGVNGRNGATGTIGQIGFATSKDGVSWTRSPDNPILKPGASGTWDSGSVENQCAVQYQNGYLLYYDAYIAGSNTAINAIGMVQSPQGFAIPEFNAVGSVVILVASLTLVALASKKKKPSIFKP